MKVFAMAILGVLIASYAWGGQLKTTGTAPAFEATITGPDTCAAGSVTQSTSMTIRRRWTGPVTGQDSLTAVLPNTPFTMTVGVPTGTYTVTVDARDTAGNWSCPATIVSLVHGKPAKITNLGDAMLFPRRLPELLAQRFRA